MDYGLDEYAGVTWSNTGKRKIFLGWMSNWEYANVAPTKKWRSVMTVPRDLTLAKDGAKYLVTSQPVKELEVLNESSLNLNDVDARNFDVTSKIGELSGPAYLQITSDKIENFSIVLSNSMGEKIIIGYDAAANNYYIDRTKSGDTEFEKGFAAKAISPRLAAGPDMNMILVIDDASVEMFADDGISVMTSLFFPGKNFSKINIQSPDNFKINGLTFHKLKSIWH